MRDHDAQAETAKTASASGQLSRTTISAEQRVDNALTNFTDTADAIPYRSTFASASG